ncbi:MAG TPA: hypothetical protein IAC50_05100 [Candidatus Copromorpha excrementigallinarum]|uniref:Uncharacterized protein n=1 Tax=Candidatus Allocopromorpha excrementigallinarum TaxID=2840742 RepID=A0A9D1L5N8_9FIRM|nr:hypothetical protein [Candidatus Copromorpha excrementigallinarum]
MREFKDERIKRMRKFKQGINIRSKKGMELVQVAILVALAVAIGLIFKSEITAFVNDTFNGLQGFN